MSDIRFVTIGHPFKAKVFPYEGEGKILGNVETFWMSTEVAIGEGDPEDYPAAVSLSLGEGRIEVRHGDGSFWRPLLAPGMLDPLPFDAFEELAGGFTPWRDSPFLPSFTERFVDGNDSPKALIGKRMGTFDRDWYRKVEENGSGAAAQVAHAVAADLKVIDGIVYLRCPEPVLMLRTTDSGSSFRITWRLPRLEGDDDVHGPTVLSRATHTDFGLRREAARLVGTRFNFRQAWRTFPVACFAESLRVALDLAGRMGRGLEADADCVRLLRPDLLAAEVPSLDPELAASRAFAYVKEFATDLPKAAVLEWLEAREAIARGDHHAALSHLSSLLDMPEASDLLGKGRGRVNVFFGGKEDAERPLGSLVRHAIVERSRMLTPDDEAALLGMDLEEDAGFAGGPRF